MIRTTLLVGFQSEAERRQATREATETQWVPVPTHATRRTFIWSASQRQFGSGPRLTWARSGVIALALPNGDVVVIGGSSDHQVDYRRRVEVRRWKVILGPNRRN
jgi:hypothetical protein